jgi:sortase (surface protein transpeptidase)
VISIPLPTLAWAQRVRQHSLDYLISTLLFVGGLVGVGYVSLQPLFAPRSTEPPAKVASAAPIVEQTPSLPRSAPTHLEIPDIQVSTDLIELGKNADGTLEVPGDYIHAGWYRYSPTPGEIGPAIIVGHVDSYEGPAVFFYLKDLQPGQMIHITRQDGTRASFKVDNVELFDQNAFPTDAVYGNIDHAGLRLITCGGVYNTLTGRYSHNTVVYASYVPS